MIKNVTSQTELSSYYIIYNGSVNIENVGNRGISHLGEHLMCKTFEKYQTDLEKDGIDWNAYTSGNEIVFYISGLRDNVDNWKDIILESLSSTAIVTDFAITKENFEKEKKIVIQEYKDSFNDQTSNHYYNLLRKYMDYYSPIGSLKDLEKLKYIDMLNFYEKQYMNPSMVINVSKTKYKNDNIDFSNEKIETTYKIKKEGYDYEHQPFAGLKDSSNSSIIIMSELYDSTTPAYYFKVISDILSGGLNSPLYQEIREKKGLVYGLSLSTNNFNNQTQLMFNTSTDDTNADEVISLFKEVLFNPKKYLTKTRYDVVVEKLKIKYNKNEILRYNNINKFLLKDNNNLEDKINSISFDEMMQVYDKYILKNLDKWIYSIDKKEFLN